MGRIQSEHIGYRFGLLEPRNKIRILNVFCECPHCQQHLDSNKLYISVIATNRLQEAKEYAKDGSVIQRHIRTHQMMYFLPKKPSKILRK